MLNMLLIPMASITPGVIGPGFVPVPSQGFPNPYLTHLDR